MSLKIGSKSTVARALGGLLAVSMVLPAVAQEDVECDPESTTCEETASLQADRPAMLAGPEQVENRLREAVRQDRARVQIGKISRFGLLEMSRQRIRPSIEFGSHLPCRYCQGKGLVPSPETLGIGFLRKLSLETLKEKANRVKGIVPLDVADYLLNKKRREIVDIEERRGLSVQIEGDRSMMPGESEIVCRS
mgnify:CR=1 FL=1